MIKAISNFMFGMIVAFLLYGTYAGAISVLLSASIGVALAIAIICIVIDGEVEEGDDGDENSNYPW